MAFVSSVSISSFQGTKLSNTPLIERLPTSKKQRDEENITVPSMKMSFYSPMKNLLSKYDTLSKAPGTYVPPSQPSSVWVDFVKNDMYSNVLKQYVDIESFDVQLEVYMYRYRSKSTYFSPPGGSPIISTADKYMSDCITKQYKQTACTTGVYSVSCTEGTVKHLADQSRVMSLGKDFKSKQKSSFDKYGTMYEMRKRATILSHQCNYEESLYNKLPLASATAVKTFNESIGACSRVVSSSDTAESYMMNVVDKTCKQMQSCSTGVYSTNCSDGTVKDMAEDKRVIGLAAKFRENQLPLVVKCQRDYDRKKYARDFFAHGCSCEEDLFNKYPKVAASMSARGSPY